MSDDQDEVDDVDDQDDEPPAIDEDEFADLESVSDKIEAETNPGDDEDGDDDRDDSADQDEAGDLEDLDAEDLDRVSVGTVYCNGLGMAGAVARTTWGTADEDRRDELMDEYADVAEQLEIDKCVDDWLEQHGGVDELSPGQATVVLTALWMGMVAMDDPDMIGNIAGEVGA